MKTMRHTLWPAIFSIGLLTGWLPAYTFKPLPALAAADCPAWQESGGLAIGAYPYIGKRIREIFDTKDLFKEGLVPVLIVAHNRNSFRVSLAETGMSIYLPSGDENKPVPWEVAAANILKSNLPAPSTTGSGPWDIIRLAGANKSDMIEDFKKKSFGPRTLAPDETVRAVVFFRLGQAPDSVAGTRLYVSDITNADTGEEMLYLEFDLKAPPEPKK